MLFTETGKSIAPSRGAREDIMHIQRTFNRCREQYGADGPYLFGKFSIADAFYAPAVSRFRTWSIKCEGAAADYATTIWSLPSMQQWLKGAQAEMLEAEEQRYLERKPLFQFVEINIDVP